MEERVWRVITRLDQARCSAREVYMRILCTWAFSGFEGSGWALRRIQRRRPCDWVERMLGVVEDRQDTRF
jgi:hypothetical protein